MYGHLARKATWLYAFGVRELPALSWGVNTEKAYGVISRCYNGGVGRERPRVTDKHASATPTTFRDVLVSIARSVRKERM